MSAPQNTNLATLPPHDIEAEMSVLGSMLLGNEARTLEALELLTGDDFYRDAHGRIFEAARRIVDRGEPLDIITLHAALPDIGVGMNYLLQLSEIVPSPASIIYYARIVRENATLRRLRELAAPQEPHLALI